MSHLPPAYQEEKAFAIDGGGSHGGRRTTKALKRVLITSLAVVGGLHLAGFSSTKGIDAASPLDAATLSAGLSLCDALYAPKPSFGHRLSPENERRDPHEPSYLLRNGTIYTSNGEVIQGGDVLIADGLIKKVSQTPGAIQVGEGVKVIELGGRWVTPGIVDIHSHMGVGAAPGLAGNSDTNSVKSPTLPYLRSIDGFSTTDAAFANSIAGGITSMQVLPGSANNIGGEAFFFKPRPIRGGSPSDMVLEPPIVFDGGKNGSTRVGGRVRRAKFAQGENIMRVHGGIRMDQGHWFRQTFEAGRKQMLKEDAWCAKGKDNTEPFPIDLEWEMVADLLRGNVKVNVHSYQSVDFDLMARLSNEFRFSVSALHHATEAYLTPDLLKRFFGRTPAVAQFATHARYKWESWRGSEYAPLVLADAGITNILKSDHPVLDSRYLMWEAAQAHHFGLNWTLAMDSVFSAPARTAGLDHRIGFVVEGHDADLVVWDSMPLSLGATPAQVFIDGVRQLADPHVVEKPKHQHIPQSTSDAAKRAKAAVDARGELSYAPRKTVGSVVFVNVRSVFDIAADSGEVEQTFGTSYDLTTTSDDVDVDAKQLLGTVIVRDAKIVCAGTSCDSLTAGIADVVDLRGGSLLPALVSYGAPLGIVDLPSEPSTKDGEAFDVLAPKATVPELLRNRIIKGVEALSLGQKDLQIAHHSGLLTAISHPSSPGLISGLSSAFRTSAPNVLAYGAIVQDVGALHAFVGHGQGAGRGYNGGSIGSVSSQVRALRSFLLGGADEDSEAADVFARVAQGKIPLCVAVNKADHIAALINMKRAVEHETGHKLRLVLEGGHESHLLADELAAEHIGVIINPPRSYPGTWDTQRTLAGPPQTEHTLASFLTSKGVVVGLGHATSDATRNARFDAIWGHMTVPSVLTPAKAIGLVSANLLKLLGVDAADAGVGRYIAVEGDAFGMGSRVVGIVDNGRVELL